MELVSEDAVKKWRQVIGPTNSLTAKAERPDSIRALFGTDGTRNAVHGSDSMGSMKRETDFWFESQPRKMMPTTAKMDKNSTLCILKPHIIKSGQVG